MYTSTEITEYIIESLKTVSEETLPQRSKQNKTDEIWKNDIEFNQIIKERRNVQVKTDVYKQLTKKLKKRVNLLRNKKLADEANEINEHACRRDIENLYRCMNTNGNTFGEIKRKKTCDPNLLKNHFVKHFNPAQQETDPPEFTKAPEFLKKLQNLPENSVNTAPPSEDELFKTIMKMKNGKSANDIPAIYINLL